MFTISTMMMMMVVMVVMPAIVNGQNPWPVKPLDSWRKQQRTKMTEVAKMNEQTSFHDFYFVDADLVPNGLYNQLFVTADEAAEACRKMNAPSLTKSGKGGATAAHPRSCFASLVCVGSMFNPKRLNTTYLFKVHVRRTSPGTYYNPRTYLNERFGLDNSCASDPCKTKKPMATGRTCGAYITCEKNKDGVLEYKESSCPKGSGFSVILGRCSPDPKCIPPPTVKKTEIVRCYATGRPEGIPKIPGVPDEAYYNRTYRTIETGEETTLPQMCPASLVFDPNNDKSTKLCNCVLPPKKKGCVNTTLINAGSGTPLPWGAAINSRAFTVTVGTQGSTRGWARFLRDRDFNYFDAQALAENELAGDWSLTFRFKLDATGGNPPSFALVQNTHNLKACPTPSLRVSVVNSNTLKADLLTKGSNHAVSAQLQNFLSSSVSESVEVVVERKKDTLTLKARKNNNEQYRQITANGLGRRPLVSNRCGLVFGDEFTGWIESVRLQIFNCK